MIRERRNALQWLGAAPGRLVHALGRSPSAIPSARVSLAELAEIVERSPRANGYLSLEPGLRIYRREEGVLTWASCGRTAFAVGGMHSEGTPQALLERFVADARAAGYRRALLFPVSQAERSMTRDAGFSSVMVGSEAFIDLPGWSLSGKAKADLRQMVNRGTKRYGIRASEIGPLAELDELSGLYDQWMEARIVKARMKLLVGTPCFDRPARRRYFIAHAGDPTQPVAFCTITPGAELTWGLDVMVRPPDAPAGAMDVLLARVLEILQAEGAKTFSLGAAPMAERVAAPQGESRFLHGVFRWLYKSWLGNRIFNFASLARYKDKFAPRWEAVYLAGSPRIGVWSLYVGCLMWGLFGHPPLDPPRPEQLADLTQGSGAPRLLGPPA